MNVIINGAGQTGLYIAKLLLSNGCSVKVLENNSDVFRKVSKELPENVLAFGSGTNPTFLETVGIGATDVVIASTGLDEVNLVASTIAKFEFGVPHVIACVNNPRNAWLFNKGMGVDTAINQADLISHLVIEGIDMKNAMTLLKVSRGNFSIIRFDADKKSLADGKMVKNLSIPDKAVLIAVFRGDNMIIPRGDTVIKADDEIMALSDEESREALEKIFCV